MTRPMLLPKDSSDQRPARRRAAGGDALDAQLSFVDAQARALERNPDAAGAARLLLEAGALESAVADGLNPDADLFGPADAAWRALTMETARLVRHIRRKDEVETRLAFRRLFRALSVVSRASRPDAVTFDAPPAFGGRALDPDAYGRAAQQFLASSVRAPAVVIGLRGAGASLSAAVAAELDAAGRRVESLTVRPRGEGDDRVVVLGERLARRLRVHAEAGSWFLIVSDGPRRSGASFHAAGAALNALGAGDEQIVLFPSIDTDGSDFASLEARTSWRRRRRVLAPFPKALPGLGAPISLLDVVGA